MKAITNTVKIVENLCKVIILAPIVVIAFTASYVLLQALINMILAG